MKPDLFDSVGWLRQRTPLPICIGFGISQPEHVRLLAPVADGLIVGSAIVRRIAEAHGLSLTAQPSADLGGLAVTVRGMARRCAVRRP